MMPAASLRALVLALSAVAPAALAQTLVPARSEVVFINRQMGVPVEGRFKRFDAQLAFDPKQPEASKVALTIELASVVIGTAEVEAEIAKPEWFATRQFPQASFRSSAVRPLGAGKYEIAGTLTIKGQTRHVVVPVALAQTGTTTTATGRFTIKRLDFGIGTGEWSDTSLVSDEVLVTFKLALTGMPAS